jgi:hypothetical protein
MELVKIKATKNKVDPSSPLYKPGNYKEMDEWLNVLSGQAWKAILGSYAAGGHSNVVSYLKTTYKDNIEKWKEKDLIHYFNCRKWSDFRTRGERFTREIK